MNYCDDYRAVLANQSMNIYDVNEGFIKGTIFKSLYDPYKNYQPKAIIALDDKEKCMLTIQKLGVATHDLSLYLDLYPLDINAINLRAKYSKELSEAIKDYERKYEAVTLEASSLTKAPWNWSTTSWPWEENK